MIGILVVATLTRGIPLPLGVVGHEGSTVIVVLNGLRLLRTKNATFHSRPTPVISQRIPVCGLVQHDQVVWRPAYPELVR